MNDINVLDWSSIAKSILNQTFNTSVEPYVINGHSQDWLYFLADGIYPKWAIFVKTIAYPSDVAEQKYTTRQKAVRKDIERCFGVLMSRFGILAHSIRQWYRDEIKEIIDTCVIIHNMTVIAHRDDFNFNNLYDDVGDVACNGDNDITSLFSWEKMYDEDHTVLAERVTGITETIEDQELHQSLRRDLMYHIKNIYYNN